MLHSFHFEKPLLSEAYLSDTNNIWKNCSLLSFSVDENTKMVMSLQVKRNLTREAVTV